MRCTTGSHADVALDHGHDQVGGVDDGLDTQRAEGVAVLGIVDAGNSAGTAPRKGCAELTDDDVVLVVARHGNHQVGPINARIDQPAALGRVVRNDGVANLVLQGPSLQGVALHDDDLVAPGQQVAGQLAANLAAAGDDDEHRPLASVVRDAVRLGRIPAEGLFEGVAHDGG